MREAGITIFDVLVIMAVIVIGVVILLPAFSRHGQPAHKSVCKSNLKNIGLCAKMYAQDYRDMWPAFHSGDSPENARDADELSILYDLFIPDAALLKCPSVDTKAEASVDTSLGLPIVLNVSYTYIGNGPTDDEYLSAKWVVSDWWNEGDGPNQRPGSRNAPAGSLPPSNHEGGINALFGDGHVEWLSGGKPGVIRGHRGDLPTDDKDLWTKESKQSVLYAGDGTIDDIPEPR